MVRASTSISAATEHMERCMAMVMIRAMNRERRSTDGGDGRIERKH